MLKVAIWNLKGGTGKSSTAQNLGAELVAAKFRTVLIDLDGQRTLSYSFGMEKSSPNVLDWLERRGQPLLTGMDGLYLVPGDIGMFQISSEEDVLGQALARLKGFDVCLMDCPPSLGAPTLQAIWNADRLLMPTLMEPASLKGLAEAVELIKDERQGLPVDILRTRYKPRLRISRDAADQLIEGVKRSHYTLLKTAIPENVAIAEAIARQMPVSEHLAGSLGAAAYRDLAQEVASRWKLSQS
ncbi:Chromosome-partitioning ATPase Soj [Halomicronema hongdechloris C2206]|uniref:Chromosome-partitioning ATPase Soj n=1 Tax=Halomicronema hongdechloris C2206 TaxID=1641165 RepID=A0A1Z3HG34_9CYAN|nr:ParA family protein [Halomicronema hongdechloris]ASC69225.1 Chromosome-partitioning ATPase Soj [Halomicronema hongdechloris C2206]